MRYLVVSFFVFVLSIFRLPVKAAKKTITKFAYSSSIFKDYRDSIISGVDSIARQFVEYAETLIGTPYLWGSANPKMGVDCSGFVNYVSKHFDIPVPRTSSQFTHFAPEVKIEEAKAGDIILFTGSNPKKKVVGHMGIVVDNPGENLSFIHSSSGHKKGVHISELKGYYKKRLVKIIRIFRKNNVRMEDPFLKEMEPQNSQPIPG